MSDFRIQIEELKYDNARLKSLVDDGIKKIAELERELKQKSLDIEADGYILKGVSFVVEDFKKQIKQLKDENELLKADLKDERFHWIDAANQNDKLEEKITELEAENELLNDEWRHEKEANISLGDVMEENERLKSELEDKDAHIEYMEEIIETESKKRIIETKEYIESRAKKGWGVNICELLDKLDGIK